MTETQRFISKGSAHVALAAGWTAVPVSFVLLPKFTLLAFSSAIEPLRMANQLTGQVLFQWQTLSDQGSTREGKKWVLKSPHHLTAADTVLDEFPDCKIVMTHRSPTSAVPSYASMVQAMTSQYSDQVDPLQIGPYWSDRFRECLAGFADVRARRPDRFVDVPFKATVAEPLDTAQRVLDALGLPVGPADLAAFEDYLEVNRQERHGSHTYTPEQFGLSAAQLETDFHFYTEAYL